MTSNRNLIIYINLLFLSFFQQKKRRRGLKAHSAFAVMPLVKHEMLNLSNGIDEYFVNIL
jgi:hypothetical protein